MTAGGVVDFYVVALAHFVSTERTWLIRVGTQPSYMGIHVDHAEAIADAIRMAQYRVASGKIAQVHAQEDADLPWHTVWCPPGVAPRYP